MCVYVCMYAFLIRVADIVRKLASLLRRRGCILAPPQGAARQRRVGLGQHSTTQTHVHTACRACAGHYMSRACSLDHSHAPVCYDTTTCWGNRPWQQAGFHLAGHSGSVQPQRVFCMSSPGACSLGKLSRMHVFLLACTDCVCSPRVEGDNFACIGP